ncbi:hypothetical protein WH47_09905 [Habropoda laboriosa]|uniref:DUF4794 domain-containing protein n=1 Tax=Habropoda laboriosa TaxID=597456 RepID=A0A0L7R3G9_9HYME|nr:hypothetical protein WH47_09905 [Habropoda laboriosa]
MQSGIVFVTVAAVLLQNGHAGFVSLKMPYPNPAGVSYINNIAPQAHFAYSLPGKVEAQHIGYAAAQVPAVAAVPYVQHIPTVSHVPVTKYEAQPAFLEKQIDVVRRPAIQQQFFDIEERVVVRPVGSAVVELDQPTSRIPKGPAVIESVNQPSEETSVSQSSIFASSGSPKDNETIVVENADCVNVNDQGQFSKAGARTAVQVNSNSEFSSGAFVAHDPVPNVVISPNSSPEEDKKNQNRLIELLTARGNVAEIGSGLFGLDKFNDSEAGQFRGRVISATPAPDFAEPAGERVSTRRVVLNKPIETLQEVDVVEPATKIERVSVKQPTFIKTARLDHVQVHSSVPVYGKALTPTIAHAAVPLYQKTISPAYDYYH